MAPLPWRCPVDTDASAVPKPTREGTVPPLAVLGDSPEPLCTVDVEPDWDVDDLKQAVEDSQGVPKVEQRLFVQEQEGSAGSRRQRMLQNQEELADIFLDGTVDPADGVQLVRVDAPFTEAYDRICSGTLRLADAGADLRGDRWSVLGAVKRHGGDLQLAAEELKGDKEIVLEAVMNDGLALQYAVEELKSDREIVLAAVSRNGYVLEIISEELRADREVVCAAVQKDGRALRFASAALQDDPEVAKCVSLPGTKIGA